MSFNRIENEIKRTEEHITRTTRALMIASICWAALLLLLLGGVIAGAIMLVGSLNG